MKKIQIPEVIHQEEQDSTQEHTSKRQKQRTFRVRPGARESRTGVLMQSTKWVEQKLYYGNQSIYRQREEAEKDKNGEGDKDA